MPSRRAVLGGLGGLFAGAAGLIVTGAFDTAEADRTAEVEVAGDVAALLGIEPVEGPNSEYAEITGGTATIDISTTEQGADGVNQNAVTVINPILEVTNNGSDPVEIGFADELVENRESFGSGIQPATHAGDEEAFLTLWGPYAGETGDPITKDRLNATGFDPEPGSGLINNSFSYDFADSDNRTAESGETLKIGATVDTREGILDEYIPPELDDTIVLVAERGSS